MSRLFTIQEVCQMLGADATSVRMFVEQEWILPAGGDIVDQKECSVQDGEQHYLDDTDLARCRLILELRGTLGANDESIPIILHLIDQIHALRERLRQAASSPTGGSA